VLDAAHALLSEQFNEIDKEWCASKSALQDMQKKIVNLNQQLEDIEKKQSTAEKALEEIKSAYETEKKNQQQLEKRKSLIDDKRRHMIATIEQKKNQSEHCKLKVPCYCNFSSPKLNKLLRNFFCRFKIQSR
jgi:chromosome segregation ATPase